MKIIFFLFLVNCKKLLFKTSSIKVRLFEALNDNDTKLLDLLLTEAENVNTIEGGKTLLHVAASLENSKAVAILMEKGIECIQDSEGNYPFDITNSSISDSIKRYKQEMDIENLINEEKYSEAEENLKKINKIEHRKNILKNMFSNANLGKSKELEKIIELLISKGINLEFKNDIGSNPLITASFRGFIKIIKLIFNKFDINEKNNYGMTPLIASAYGGNIKLVKFLISNGANINDKNKNGDTALHFASSNGFKDIVKLLIDNGANVNDKNEDTKTALIMSSQDGHKEIVELLIENCANINDKNNHGYTALHFASNNGFEDIVKLLLLHQANIEAATELGCTSLSLAAKKGRNGVAKFLIEKGADIETKNIENTPLILAVANNHICMVKLLLKKGANVNAQNDFKSTALIVAVEENNESLVNILLKNGADTSIKDTMNFTALIHAARKNFKSIVKIIIEHKSNNFSKDLCINEAIRQALMNGSTESLKLLADFCLKKVNKGFLYNLFEILFNNISNEESYLSSLTNAVRSNDIDLISSFIVKGYSLDLKDCEGNTALMIALSNCSNGIAYILLCANADVNIKNNYNENALMLAAHPIHLSIFKLLLKKTSNLKNKDVKGNNILMLVIENKNRKALKILLKLDLDITMKNNSNKSALILCLDDFKLFKSVIKSNKYNFKDSVEIFRILANKEDELSIKNISLLIDSISNYYKNKEEYDQYNLELAKSRLHQVSLFKNYEIKLKYTEFLKEIIGYIERHAIKQKYPESYLKLLNTVQKIDLDTFLEITNYF